jgi:D-alanine-D-alanine ligase
MNKKVVLLQGGHSPEREVSLSSAKAIGKALLFLGYCVDVVDPADYNSYPDLGREILSKDPCFVFIGLHGSTGEDGTIQAFLNLLGIPFTGSDMKASVLCMDKTLSHTIVSRLGLNYPDTVVFHNPCAYDEDALIRRLGLPFVVKPNDSGSSVGTFIVRDRQGIPSALNQAFKFTRNVLCQKYISGSELTVTVLGGKALPVVEIKVSGGWYDYVNKYTKGRTVYQLPAEITDELACELKKSGEDVFRELGCRAYARIDYRYDGNDYYFLEANTLPGMTDLSLTPMAAAEAGITFPELIEMIIDYSLV